MPADDLYWIDVETTGLEGRILEIGVLRTRADLTVIDNFVSLVGPPLSTEELAELPQIVLEMHTKNGLIRELAMTPGLPGAAEVDNVLQWWLMERGRGGDPKYLAGSSVHFDLARMKEHLPRSAASFHYRLADVSALREFVRRWAPQHTEPVEALPQRKQHRVVPDLDDSLMLARYYQGVLKG